MSVSLSVCLSVCLSLFLSVCLFVYLSLCLLLGLSVSLFAFLSVCPPRGKLFCGLTHRYLNRKPDEVDLHLGGRRYLRAMEKCELVRGEGVGVRGESTEG